MEIIEMKEDHVASIAAMEKLCFSDPWSENSIASELKNPLAFWLVAVEKGAVVGYVGSQSVQGEADMMNVAVHPDFRREKIAENLIRVLLEKLALRGVSSLSLEVRASNEPAIALYNKLQFQTVGRRPNYYRHPKEDALIMRKEWQT